MHSRLDDRGRDDLLVDVIIAVRDDIRLRGNPGCALEFGGGVDDRHSVGDRDWDRRDEHAVVLRGGDDLSERVDDQNLSK